VSTSAERILLDATAVPADRGGVGRYVDGLVPALVRSGSDVDIACLGRDVELYASMGANPIPALRAGGRAGRLAWEQTGLPALARRLRPDVLHSPHYTQPLIKSGVGFRRSGDLFGIARLPSMATAVTVHDATFFSAPELHGRVKGPFFRAATRLALRRADAVIVPSHATADELERVAGADAAQLHVAHHGVDRGTFAPPGAVDIERALASLERLTGVALERGRYVAFLGTLEPRKNLPALVRGYVLAFAGHDQPPVLVLAGGKGWDGELDAALAAVPSGVRILRPGYLPLTDLGGYLGGAALVVYPSLGEGFGLPILEAMACGAAVLTTRRLALPEIGGDAVAYCDVDDASIAAALVALLEDPTRRAELGAAGVARARGFTWDACAAAHREAYDKAAQHFRSSR
jgi:glycosyltransferase involved in cell wall biosynthesis